MTINKLVPDPHTFLLPKPVPHRALSTDAFDLAGSCQVMFSPAISVLGEAAKTIWRWVNMATLKSLLRFTTTVHGSLMFSFKKSPFTLECQMPMGRKVSRLLATSSKLIFGLQLIFGRIGDQSGAISDPVSDI